MRRDVRRPLGDDVVRCQSADQKDGITPGAEAAEERNQDALAVAGNTELLLVQLVITLPYVARTMIAGLSRFDFTLIEAGLTLGCTWPQSIVRVMMMIPALAPSFLIASLFSFLASFDNYPVSIFLTDVRTKTLPNKMPQYIEEAPDPTIAALSTIILAGTVALLLIADRAVGLSRMAGTAE